MSRGRWYTSLYLQVLCAIAVAIVVGIVAPERAVTFKFLGDWFIALVKILIAPVVFATVSAGIAKMGHARDVGRVALKALFYFEVVSTIALLIGLVVVLLWRPGDGIHANPATIDTSGIKEYTGKAEQLSAHDFFAHNLVLQVLAAAIVCGLAVLFAGERAAPVARLLDRAMTILFRVVAWVMRLAPLGAFGAMAFTIGKFGPHTLLSLGRLMAGVYVTCLVFVFVVLGGIARVCGFSITRFVRYIKDELFIVLGTSSSESALPLLMEKLERAGCSKGIVGLVIPTGYSFNLDGTSIYMTMAAVFVAQAMDVHLTPVQLFTLLGVLILTSKGAAAVTGAGFITLAATLSSMHTVPVEGMALLLGVDRFMSEARALTNLVGNGVATIAIAKWDGALDTTRLAAALDPRGPEAVTPAGPGVTGG